MKPNRRSFIKKSASLAALSGVNGISLESSAQTKTSLASSQPLKDAGMQLCEAYFFGMQPQKIALAKQMDVLGAVGGINPGMVGLKEAKPWEYEAIAAVKKAWEKEGLQLKVIEGPPALGEKTKIGLPGKDEEISNFITLMKNLAKAGIDTICYNWMPAIGWYRTQDDRPGRGGALVTAFDNEGIQNLPLTQYGEVSKETLWKNLEYFLKAVVPEAEKAGIKLAMHPDDPQVDSIRGISRIMTTGNAFKRMLDIYPSPNNGITMCQGNFALMGEDIVELIKDFGKRGKIHFVHFRNVRGNKFNFEETFHDEGIIDMYQAMKTYVDVGFKGPIRPDHVPTMAGDSNEYPGYSTIGCLYALGYMRGLLESISKQKT
ncbi:TIM barrel protein [Rhodocytophaga rosea]|uniref:mannonate dehydratase n=1 Tax=Rhodocytophaga rosea TaxID=2704465 RepID=A0A6C0GLY7_9BACT|nr:mannonate dehydratase [Rhodocytophaga rosea]QHT68653.1 TIM barrel protein [Rhodocytophaga rosea]